MSSPHPCPCLATYTAELPPRCIPCPHGRGECPEMVARWQEAQAERVARVNPGSGPRHPYRIGQIVHGRNAAGLDFGGVITAVGAHHVVLDELYFTPLSLLVAAGAGPTVPVPAPKVSAVTQPDLFGD